MSTVNHLPLFNHKAWMQPVEHIPTKTIHSGLCDYCFSGSGFIWDLRCKKQSSSYNVTKEFRKHLQELTVNMWVLHSETP